MKPLFEAMLEHVPAREDDQDGPLQLQISSLDYSSYVGRIGIGRITPWPRQAWPGRHDHGRRRKHTAKRASINQVLTFKGLERVLVDEAVAGDIVLINGIEELGIGTTIVRTGTPEALPMLIVDEPTLTMNFMVNNSPLAGREGKFVTSRQMRDRLNKELKANVALARGDDTDETDCSRCRDAASCT